MDAGMLHVRVLLDWNAFAFSCLNKMWSSLQVKAVLIFDALVVWCKACVATVLLLRSSILFSFLFQFISLRKSLLFSKETSAKRHSRVPDFIPYKVWYYYINFDRVGSCNKLVFYISWGPYFKTATPSSAFFFMARIFFTMLCSPYTSMSLCFLPLFSNFKEIFDGGYCWKSRDEYEKTAWGMLPDIRSISSSWHFLARSF